MAEGIKVVMEVVEKIQRGRQLNCVSKSAWERRKQRGMNRGRKRKKKKERIMTGGGGGMLLFNTTHGEG